ncbi:MAG: hypothetical protein JNL67_06040 [Planctomycetaceae bacterium]|nr:hypothetical protein [Planctomycetaceae bacterium]
MSREAVSWILGVDAGGTKTAAWVGRMFQDAKGGHQIRWSGCGHSGPGNPNSVGVAMALHSIQTAIHAAIAAAMVDGPASADQQTPETIRLSAIWVGAAGAGRPEIASELRCELEHQFPSAEVTVTTDIALLISIAQSADLVEAPEWIRQPWSSAIASRTISNVQQAEAEIIARAKSSAFFDRGQPVIAIISGTGSIVWAIDGQGNEKRWGGFGPQIGDIGSGCWFGQQAIQAILAELDNRGPATSLRSVLLPHLNIPDGIETRQLLMDRMLTPAELAALAPLVLATADHDAVANEMVQTGVEGLIAMGCAALAWLGPRASIHLVLGGGLLVSNTGLLNRVWQGINEFLKPQSAVEKLNPEVECQGSLPVPKISAYLSHQPVWGALVSAADKLVSGAANR